VNFSRAATQQTQEGDDADRQGSHDGHGGGGIFIEQRDEPVHDSITFDHEVVSFFAISRRATVDANA